jgi:hypothetical protein
MTRYRVVSILVAGVLMAAVIVLCALAQNTQNRQATSKQEESVTLPQVDYVLGEYEGYLALFRGEQTVPYQILDMPVQLLSAYDRDAIAAGIHVQTEAELRQLVEDFAS